MTAKKAGSNGAGQAKATGEYPEKPDDVLRRIADDMQAHAALFLAVAEKWRELDVPDVKILPGNFYFYLSQLRDSFSTQVLGKIQKNLPPLTRSKNAAFRQLMDRLLEVEAAMPARKPKQSDE